ncbi:integrator complex subunit 12-like [Anopheles darlingi]|uniref:integrator complex subunit 12-like n=1 Tax=Anopheles darlingi TaxID=43151 RepID=UPI0021003D94|nr:integrator complex subunit 12-like [Anopheles darlingi]
MALDVDPTFKHALKLLHSANSESSEKIRNLLDELIKQRFGSSKTLINTLSKKHLAEEPLAAGSNLYVRKQKVVEPKPVPVIDLDSDPEGGSGTIECLVNAPEALTMPPVSSGPIVISTSDLEGEDDDDVVMEEDKLKELEDLMCVECRRMDVSARNRLVECADCHALYHQECHKPNISEADANDEENAWYCTLCRTKSTISKPTASPLVLPLPVATSPTTVVTSSGTKSSSSSSSSHSKSSGSGSHSSSSSSSNSKQAESSSGSKHKSSSSKSSSSSSKSSDSSHERDRERDRDRGERDRDRDRDRDRERDEREKDRDRRERDKDREKTSKSSSSSGTSSASSAASALAGANAVGTPSINIISADKRIQMMKKKAAKMHDSKRKHK